MIAVSASPAALSLAQAAAAAADDKLATDIVALDVSEQFPLADIFVLASVSNERQVSSVVDNVEDALAKAGVKPLRREGEREGRWVLLDFGDIIVHIQHEQERMYYQLERLWKDCPAVSLQLGESASSAGSDGAGSDGAGSDGAGSDGAGSAALDTP